MSERPTNPYPADIIVARIDDGVRAKLVCRLCGVETYVRILWDHTETSVELLARTLTEVAQNHREECRG